MHCISILVLLSISHEKTYWGGGLSPYLLKYFVRFGNSCLTCLFMNIWILYCIPCTVYCAYVNFQGHTLESVVKEFEVIMKSGIFIVEEGKGNARRELMLQTGMQEKPWRESDINDFSRRLGLLEKTEKGHWDFPINLKDSVKLYRESLRVGCATYTNTDFHSAYHVSIFILLKFDIGVKLRRIPINIPVSKCEVSA